VDVDLRKVLEARYRTDGSLPADVSEHLFPSIAQASSSIFSDLHDPGEDVERKIIENVLNDPNISSKEKEIIAKSILEGNFEIQRVSAQSQPIPYKHNKQTKQAQQTAAHAKDYNQRQKTELYINRHKLPKPHFLEVITQSANIPQVSPKKLHKEKVRLLRNSISLGKIKPSFRPNSGSRSPPLSNTAPVGGMVYTDSEHRNQPALASTLDNSMSLDSFPPSPFLTEIYNLERPKTSSKPATLFKDTNPTYREEYSKFIAEDRLKRLKETKEKVLADREHIKRQKEYDKLSIEKRTELKKKLNDFRQKLKDALIKKKDPMTGEIMRVMDDSLVYYLLEKYSGYSMSPEAILALLGSSIGNPVINPEPPEPDEAPSTMHIDTSFDTGGIGPGTALSNENLFLAGGESSLMRKSISGSLSAQLSYTSLINNYQSFGHRSPTLGTRPSPPSSPPHTIPPYADNIFDRTIPASIAFRHNVPAINTAPVTGFNLRNIEHDPHTAPNVNFKAYAGGFRAKTAALNPPITREEQLRDHHPLLRNPTSPHAGDSGRRSPLVVLSSEHFRSIAFEMGYHYPSLIPKSEDPLADRKEAERKRKEEEKTNAKINDAISVMHEQLLEEGMLPSLRPEKILTMRQLEEIGLHKTTVDELFKKMTGKDLRHVLKRAPANRAEEIKAKLARSPTVSASQLTLINDLLELEREQSKPSTTTTTAPANAINEVEGGGGDPSLATPRSLEESERIKLLSGALKGERLDTIITPERKIEKIYSSELILTTLPVTPSAEPPAPGILVFERQSSRLGLSRGDTARSLHTIPEAKSKSNDSLDDFQNNKKSPILSRKPSLRRMQSSSGKLTFDSSMMMIDDPTVPSHVLFHGTNMMNEETKQHLEEIAKIESAKAAKRLVLPAARVSQEVFKELLEEFPIIKESVEREEKEEMEKLLAAGNRKGSTSGSGTVTPINGDGKKSSKPSRQQERSYFKEFPQLDDQFPQKGPKSLKTRYMPGGSFMNEHAIDHAVPGPLPQNPYKSWNEETNVMNTGVPAGAGLMLWQSRDRATELGRYRVGRNSSRQSPLRPLPKEVHHQGSIGNPPNWNVIGYQGVHGDNVYAKSQYKIKPFVSAI